MQTDSPAGADPAANGAPTRRATLRDVAALAGVDPSTASRLLRNHTAGYRSETVERVQIAAQELGYRTNTQARALRLGRQQAIAMLVPDLDNFGFTQVLRGIQDVCNENDFTLLISEVQDRPDQPHFHPTGFEGRVDGVLVAFATADDPGVDAWLARLGLPAVLVQRGSPAASASVLLDEERNAATVLEYLYSLGHRDIGHVSGSLRTDTGLRRHNGFEDAAKRLGLTLEDHWRAAGGFSFAGGYEAAWHILGNAEGRRPTALAVDSLVDAVGVFSALRELGISVPDDLSVMAIDEHVVAAQTTPPLTTLRLPQRELGQRAARMLLDMIGGGEGGERVIIETDPTIVPRESTRPLG